MTLIETILVPLVPTFFSIAITLEAEFSKEKCFNLCDSCDSCDLEWSDMIWYQEYLNFIS